MGKGTVKAVLLKGVGGVARSGHVADVVLGQNPTCRAQPQKERRRAINY